jgi:hypothetical protein
MRGFALWPIGMLLAALIAAPTTAGTIRLRSGEHPGFTRLVLDGGTAEGWRLGRAPGGYLLILNGEGWNFDTAKVFARIPRTRLDDVRLGPEPGQLFLSVPCACHASAMETADGKLVIDMKDGPAPADSPFETMTEAAAGPGPEAEGKAGIEKDAAATAAPVEGLAATLRYRADHNQEASLQLYWRDTPPTAAGPEAPTEPSLGRAREDPAPAPSPPKQGTGPLADGQAGTAAVVPPGSGRADAAPGLPPLPDPGAVLAERDLLLQLGRAASQGLVLVEEPLAQPQPPEDMTAGAAEEETVGVPPEAAEPEEAEAVASAGFRAETVLDRDARKTMSTPQPAPDGSVCPADAALTIRDWGDDRPAGVQIAEARSGLTGEFDRPDPAAVERLVRLYIYLGLGAEARQAIAGFGTDVPDRALLTGIAFVLDDRPVPEENPIRHMSGCGGDVAVWSVLAAPEPGPGPDVDLAAVLRGFSGLPGGLRLLLGQRLADRLLALGAREEARLVRAAMARLAGEGDRSVAMIGAEIALAAGQEEEALELLEPVADRNDALSLRTVQLTLERQLAQGGPVAPGLIETAAALAFEHRKGPQGPLFSRLEILARATNGDFAGALATYDRWPGEAPDAERSAAGLGLARLFAGRADDTTFLNGFFGHPTLFDAARADEELTFDLAERLLALGFAAEVRALVDGPAADGARGRVALARAALQLFEPGAALTRLGATGGAEAERLRGDALAMLGRHGDAAEAYAQAGASDEAARAALRAGDWGRAAAGSDAIRDIVAMPAAPRQDDPHASPLSLADSRSALEASAALRQGLTALLGPADDAAEAAPNP